MSSKGRLDRLAGCLSTKFFQYLICHPLIIGDHAAISPAGRTVQNPSSNPHHVEVSQHRAKGKMGGERF